MSKLRDEKEWNIIDLISSHRQELMGLAAFLVLFFHIWVPLFRSVPILREGEGFFKRIIYFSVDIFFFVSGFGLPRAIRKQSIVLFYYRRIRRFIFPFLFIALLSFFTRGWSVKYFFYAITGVGFWLETMYFFLWFIPAILILYFLFPFYYRFLSSADHPGLFTLAVLELWLLFAMLASGFIREDYYGMINRIPVFLIGASLGDLSKRGAYIRLPLSLCILTLILGLYLSYRTNYTHMFLLVPESNCAIPNILITVSLCPILALLMEKTCSTNLIRRFFLFLGSISLELYCVQEWLAFLIWEPIKEHLPPLAANLILFPVIITAGFLLSWANRSIMKRMDHAIIR